MKKTVLALVALATLLGMTNVSHASVLSYGTRTTVSSTATTTTVLVTYVNNSNDWAQGVVADGNRDFFYTGGKLATFTASPNAIGFSYGTHVTYTRLLEKWGTRYYWVNRYVFDGYNLYLNVPAQSTVYVTAIVNR